MNGGNNGLIKIIKNEDDLSDVFNSTHSTHQILSSNIPDECKNEPCMLGVDEAGRGPVLGPMVYGICYTPINKLADLKSLGCADSKTLTEEKREELFSILCACEDYIGWSVDIISPNMICNNMLKRVKFSLNEIAQTSTVTLIKNVIDNGLNVAEIYVDTVGPPEKYQDKLSKIFPQCKVTVAKKADSLYPVVSAASICAKVIRDRTIQNWKYPENFENCTEGIGSGYPNDPTTKEFLTKNIDDIFGFPHLVRFSWSTAAKILEKSTTVEWEEEDECEVANCKSISQYFKQIPSGPTNKHQMKHDFFKDRNLSNVDNF